MTATMADPGDVLPARDVTPARGVLISPAAAREIVGAVDELARLAAPEGRQLSGRLRLLRRELATCANLADTHAGVSADGVVAQPPSQWNSMVDTSTAAQILGLTNSGVTWLCRNGRLTAARVGGRWLIDAEALHAYLDLRPE